MNENSTRRTFPQTDQALAGSRHDGIPAGGVCQRRAQQRAHIQELKTQIAQREANIDDLEREKRRWRDPAYVQAQARERFGYLMPGETLYVVLDENGDPLETQTSLTDPATVADDTPTAWWTSEWKSVQLAGVPPKPQAPPVSEIDGSRG